MNDLIAEVLFTFLYISVASIAGKISKRVNTYPVCYLILSLFHITVVTVLFLTERIELPVYTRQLIVMFPGGAAAYSLVKGPFHILFPDEETVKILALAVWLTPFLINGAGRSLQPLQKSTVLVFVIGLVAAAIALLVILLKYDIPRESTNHPE